MPRKVNTDDCWLWARTITPSGYGDISVKVDGVWKSRRAHRIVYEALVGDIPEGLVLDHLCRVRCCVNPDHLEPVTVVENIHRGITKTKEYCKSGHRLSPDNIWVTRQGWRRCKTCNRTRMAIQRAGLYYLETVYLQKLLGA